MDAIFRFGTWIVVLAGAAVCGAALVGVPEQIDPTSSAPTCHLATLLERDVQKALALTHEQIKGMKKCHFALQNEIYSIMLRNRTRMAAEATPAEQQEREELSKKQIDAQVAEYDRRVQLLLRPDQLRLLDQFVLQRHLAAGLNKSEIAASLGLRESQKSRLRKFAATVRRNNQSALMAQQIQDYVLECLDDEQIEQLQLLRGSRFTFGQGSASSSDQGASDDDVKRTAAKDSHG